MPLMQTVIFSKDRPAQLELLLRSYKEMAAYEIPEIICLSRGIYDNAYRIVQNIYTAHWTAQGDDYSVKDALMRVIRVDIPYIMFLVDDDVFIRQWSYDDKEFRHFISDISIATLSLRLGPGLSYCYAYNTPMVQPEFNNGRFRWQNAPGDFGWLMSLDGNIYRTADIYNIIREVEFKTPNELEGLMMIRKDSFPPYVMTYSEPRLINIPDNRVQNIANNRCMNLHTTDWLCYEFVSGKRISMENLRNYKAPSCHCELEYRWEEDMMCRNGEFYYQ